MNDKERRATRNLLFACGAGRFTGNWGFPWTIDGVIQGHGVGRGFQQQGTFSCMNDYQTLPALVVAGEESGADPAVLKYFLDPAKPKNYDNRNKAFPYDWVRLTSEDTGPEHPAARPYPEAVSWTNARKVDVDNLQREIWWFQDLGVTPWGFATEHEAYMSICDNQMWPSALVYARFGAENQYVTGYYYALINHLIYNSYAAGPERKSDSFSTAINNFDHHAEAETNFPVTPCS